MREELKKELWKKSACNLKEGKKKVSGVIISPQGSKIMNHGEGIEYDRIDVVWKAGNKIEEWCLDCRNRAATKLPAEPMCFISIKNGRLLVAEYHGKDEEPEIYVCGCDEEDDKVVLLMLITMPGGYIFQYWNGWTHMPRIYFPGERFENTLPNLYQEMRSFLLVEGKSDSADERRHEEYGLPDLGF